MATTNTPTTTSGSVCCSRSALPSHSDPRVRSPRSLMEAGWSPTAAVTARLAGGALVMAIFATIVKPDWFREALQHYRTVVAYGLIPIAGAQLCYYNAVAHLSVGVALLLEYTAPILVVGWLWATTRRRPSIVDALRRRLGGGRNHVGAQRLQRRPHQPDRCRLGPGRRGLRRLLLPDVRPRSPPTAMTACTRSRWPTGGLIVGTAAVALLGVTGVMPLTFTTNDTVIAGLTTSWMVPVIALALIPTAIAYTLGIMGISRLRPRFASLVGLSEVMFAVLAAWVLVGEAITLTQAIGGAVVLLGLALARQGDRTEKLADASWPDGPVEELATRR